MTLIRRLRSISGRWTAVQRRQSPSGARLLQGVTVSLLFAGSLLTGFYLTFPARALQERLVAEFERYIPAALSVKEMRLDPLATLRSRDLDVHFLKAPALTLKIDALQLSPWWGSLLHGSPGVVGNAALLGGELEFEAHLDGAIHAKAQRVNLDLPFEGAVSLRLKAHLAGGEFQGAWPIQASTRTRLETQWDSVELHGPGLLLEGDRLTLGNVHLGLRGQGRSLSLERFVVSGGDIEAVGSGTLILAADPRDSRIALDLSLAVTERTPRNLIDLLSLVGPRQPDGRYALKLTGTLGNPVVRSQEGDASDQDDS